MSLGPYPPKIGVEHYHGELGFWWFQLDVDYMFCYPIFLGVLDHDALCRIL